MPNKRVLKKVKLGGSRRVSKKVKKGKKEGAYQRAVEIAKAMQRDGVDLEIIKSARGSTLRGWLEQWLLKLDHCPCR